MNATVIPMPPRITVRRVEREGNLPDRYRVELFDEYGVHNLAECPDQESAADFRSAWLRMLGAGCAA